MTRVAVVGASGRLGRLVLREVIEREELTLAAALTRPGSSALGIDVGTLAGVATTGIVLDAVDEGSLGQADVVIDVSLPEGTRMLLPRLDGRALVTGVTGLGTDDLGLLDALATASPVLLAANFSAGVHVLVDAVRRAAAALPEYDIEVVEAHHRHKLDAPSGTADVLARAAAEGRGWDFEEHATFGRHGRTGPRGEEIAIHALRCGDVIGEHTVWLAGEGERVQLGHVATRRETFAKGAVRAAAWLSGRAPGRYTMRDVLGLERRA